MPSDHEDEQDLDLPDFWGISKRGMPKLVKPGYAYVQDQRGQDDVVYWRCERRDKLSCKGRLKTEDGSIVAYTGSHNHAGDATRAEVVGATTRVMELTKSSWDSSQRITSQATTNVSEVAAVALPSARALKRSIQRAITQAGNLTARSHSLVDIIWRLMS